MTEQRIRELLNAGLSPASAAAIAASEAIQEAAIEDGGIGAIGVATITVTAAQIRTLNAMPVEMAPALAAGKMYLILGGLYQRIDGTTAYARPGNSRLEVGPREMVVQDYSTWETPREAPMLTFGQDDSQQMSLSGGDRFPSALADGEALVVGNPGKEFDGGVILAATVEAPGSGYAPGDQFTIKADPSANEEFPNTSSAIGEVDTVDGGGGVLTFHLVSGGNAGEVYSASYGNPYLTINTDGGGDNALTVTITETEHGDGTLEVTVVYAVVDLA